MIPEPISVEINGAETNYEFELDINCCSCVRVCVTKRSDDSHIVVKNLSLNNIAITNLNAISFLRTNSGEIRRNHGYLDSVGDFIIKIRTNAVSLNYLNYLLSLTK